MARKKQYPVIVRFKAFWSEGEIMVANPKKSIIFAKSLATNHRRFLRQVAWDGKWCGHVVSSSETKLSVQFFNKQLNLFEQ